MTEQLIRYAADTFGLTVLKRITTGTERSGFATFELTGAEQDVRNAGDFLRPHFRKGFDAVTYPTNPDHPDQGKPYICCESVWFDSAK